MGFIKRFFNYKFQNISIIAMNKKSITIIKSILFSFLAIGILYGCKSSTSNMNAKPVITGIRDVSPDSAAITKVNPGQTVVLQGSNLLTTRMVSFDGMQASINPTLFSDTTLIVTVPDSIPFATVPKDSANMVMVATKFGQTSFKFPIVPHTKPGPTSLISNFGFETWNGSTPADWSVINNSNGSFAQGAGKGDVHDGNYSLMVNVKSNAANWHLQIASSGFNTNKGDSIKVSFWIKASTSGCNWQIEARGNGANTQYTGGKPSPTKWTQESYTFQAGAARDSVAFDMGDSPANSTTFIDNVVVTDQSQILN